MTAPTGGSDPTGNTNSANTQATQNATPPNTSGNTLPNNATLQTLIQQALSQTGNFEGLDETSDGTPEEETQTGSGLTKSQIVTGKQGDPGSKGNKDDKHALDTTPLKRTQDAQPLSTSSGTNAEANNERISARENAENTQQVTQTGTSTKNFDVKGFTANLTSSIGQFQAAVSSLNLSSNTINTATSLFAKASEMAQNLNELANSPNGVSQGVANKIGTSITGLTNQAYTAIVADLGSNQGTLESLFNTYGSMTPQNAKALATAMAQLITGARSNATSDSEDEANPLNTTEGYTSLENAIGGFVGAVQESTALFDTFEEFVNQTNAQIGQSSSAVADNQNTQTQNEVQHEEKQQKQVHKKEGWLGKLTASLEIVGAVVIIAASVTVDAGTLGVATPAAGLACALAVGMIVQASMQLAGGPSVNATSAIARGICEADPSANKQDVEIAVGAIACVAALAACAEDPMMAIMLISMMAEQTDLTTNATEKAGGNSQDVMIANLTVSLAPLLITGGASLFSSGDTAGELAEVAGNASKSSGESGDAAASSAKATEQTTTLWKSFTDQLRSMYESIGMTAKDSDSVSNSSGGETPPPPETNDAATTTKNSGDPSSSGTTGDATAENTGNVAGKTGDSTKNAEDAENAEAIAKTAQATAKTGGRFTMDMPPGVMKGIATATRMLMGLDALGTIVAAGVNIQIQREKKEIANMQESISISNALLESLDFNMRSINTMTPNVDNQTNTDVTNLLQGNASVSQNAASQTQMEFPG